MSPERPLILVTNDDGVASPGLLSAIEAVAGLGDLLVVAPSNQQTGMGRSTPAVATGVVVPVVLKVQGRDVPAYAVPGSPAQAAMYGVLALARARGRLPRLAVSGVNYGENLGSATTASGTVGAALEAASYGIPSLAVSLETAKAYHYNHGHDVQWQAATAITAAFARAMLARRLPADVDVLKVDIPEGADQKTPWRITRQSRQRYYESFPLADVPDLRQFDYRVSLDLASLEPDSDIHAFAVDRVISVTPLSIDLTARTDFAALDRLLRS